MDNIGSIIVDSVFGFGGRFNWASLFGLIRDLPFIGLLKAILEMASPKNKYLF